MNYEKENGHMERLSKRLYRIGADGRGRFRYRWLDGNGGRASGDRGILIQLVGHESKIEKRRSMEDECPQMTNINEKCPSRSSSIGIFRSFEEVLLRIEV